MTHETDLIAGPDLEMRLCDPVKFAGSREAQFLPADQLLRFRPGLAQARAKQPDIQSAAVLFTLAQDLSPLSPPSFLRAASAANGEFSIDLLGREDLPAE